MGGVSVLSPEALMDGMMIWGQLDRNGNCHVLHPAMATAFDIQKASITQTGPRTAPLVAGGVGKLPFEPCDGKKHAYPEHSVGK